MPGSLVLRLNAKTEIVPIFETDTRAVNVRCEIIVVADMVLVVVLVVSQWNLAQDYITCEKWGFSGS